jgi:uncharacterized membrane protein YwzB
MVWGSFFYLEFLFDFYDFEREKLMLGWTMMKRLVERLIYLVFTLFIFVVLWKGTAILWEAFVPWNYRTDLFGILIVTPLLIVLSFILSTLAFQYRKDS